MLFLFVENHYLKKHYLLTFLYGSEIYKGKVVEIGIRSTKVEDIEGNIKIFYNSAVGGVVNMTRRPSAVRMDVKIDAQHSFEHVESELSNFFALVSDKYPQIKDDCKYLGVVESTPAFNIYRIAIPCDEKDRAPLHRAMIKEFTRFCMDRNLKKL